MMFILVSTGAAMQLRLSPMKIFMHLFFFALPVFGIKLRRARAAGEHFGQLVPGICGNLVPCFIGPTALNVEL